MAHVENEPRINGQLSPVNGSTGAETVIAPRPLIRREKDSSSENLRRDARRGVALVEGSTPHLSAETRDLLRNRLRIAAIMFFVGFSAFLIRWLFHWNEWIYSEQMPLFYTHGVVTAILGAFAVRLCRHCAYPLTKLRIAELVIFGCPAFFFLMMGLRDTSMLLNLHDGNARLAT